MFKFQYKPIGDVFVHTRYFSTRELLECFRITVEPTEYSIITKDDD